MKYIRSCPNCRTDLRFPLDMGILIVTCPNCGFSFKVDPDDPLTYKEGTFDLKTKKEPRLVLPNLSEIFKNYKFNIKQVIFFFLVFLLVLNVFKICKQVEVAPNSGTSPTVEPAPDEFEPHNPEDHEPGQDEFNEPEEKGHIEI